MSKYTIEWAKIEFSALDPLMMNETQDCLTRKCTNLEHIIFFW